MSTKAAILKSADGAAVPLRGVSASGRLNGLLFELTVEQSYENTGRNNIEAVYTFPIPHHAVLLGLELEIGERKLSGVAVRRKDASERYEEAIDEGNTAALLEQAGDGLYTLSLGNLLAGERAVIRYRYAELLNRHEDYIRLCVPTVIAPRYGDATSHGLQAHQVPGVDLLASYPFSLSIDVLGDQATAVPSSPTHLIAVSSIDGGKRIVLGAGAVLDRDFILQLTGTVTASASVTARNGDGYVSLVSLDPQLREQTSRALCLKLVVDCSGSMAGDSIAQARHALLAVLGRLTPADALSLTRFGSNFEHLCAPGADVPGQAPRSLLNRIRGKSAAPGAAGAMAIASPPTVEWFRHAVHGLEADLGGTDLQDALQAAMAIPTAGAEVKDLLLITDGEVWAVADVVDLAARSGHRLFVVAVGAAPAESLARQLSEKTGGACEFVSPNEDIEGAILRMFQRLRETPKRITKVEWPTTPDWEAPVPAMVFSGDTLHLLAGFRTKPAGEVRVTISGAACGEMQLPCAVSDPVNLEILPRVAASRRLASLDDEEAGALAEQYQLVSAHTSFVVVQTRAEGEKAETLPELKAVGQMLAAGWGATGGFADVLCAPLSMPAPTFSARSPATRQVAGERGSTNADLFEPDFDSYIAGANNGPALAPALPPQEILARLALDASHGKSLPTTLAELAALGFPQDLLEQLAALVDNEGHEESSVVRVLIALLARSAAGAGLSIEDRTALEGSVMTDRKLRSVRAAVQPLVANVTVTAWEALERSEEQGS
ncbi:MAG: VWA domain-containing protein [Gammaproteobacteria bacterium]|nr:VWA domain-containing protein [Gammaproteobacteria bacterium]